MLYEVITDFLLSVEDVHISYRAGADAVLLIASILEKDLLERMYSAAQALGIEALVEVHEEDDIAKVRELAPALVGINCRDLNTFVIDQLHPLRMKKHIGWKA